MTQTNLRACPKCGENISELLFSETVTNLGTFTLDRGHQEDCGSSFGPKEYHCPSCAELLFNEDHEAYDFLRGGDLGRRQSKMGQGENR